MKTQSNLENLIYLRQFEMSDLDFLISVRKQKDIFSLTAGNTYFGSAEYTKKMLVENLISDGSKLYLLICKSEDSMPIGYISIIDIDHINKKAQWGGIVIDPQYSGKGYGTYAGQEMLKYLFLELNMNKVYGYWLDTNVASLKMASKLGFGQEGLLHKHIFKNNCYNDLIIMSIFKKDFLQVLNRGI